MDFFPTTTDNPIITPTETSSLIIEDLLTVLKDPPPMSPFLLQSLGLTNAIEALQSILRPPLEQSVQQQRVSEGETTWEQRVRTPEIRRIDLTNAPTPSPPTIRRISVSTSINKRATQSTPTVLYPLGTIICRRCEIKNLFHEGEVMIYDPTNNLYRIKYKDEDIDDFNYEELTKYCTPQQKYCKVLKLKQINTPNTHTNHEHDIFFIPTKANPNPIGRD